MAPLIYELKRQQLDCKVCVTAQHREMLDQVLKFFEIVPDYDLDLMRADQSLNTLSGKILISIDNVLSKVKPDLLIVHGDTTTSVMAAWAAFHRKIKVAHVEAGLRTFNSLSPFPEEINRQITARLTDYHFAPTIKARDNLLLENIPKNDIYMTGNTIVDAVSLGILKLQNIDESEIISETGILPKRFILVTGHRRESFGKGFELICEALIQITKTEKIDIIYPVHLNPYVKNHVYKKLENIENIHLINPVSYPTMLYLLKNCEFIISDSGGIQEEAPAFGKKVLVTRDFSERMEGVEAGLSILVGTSKEKIIKEVSLLLKASKSKASFNNPYGDGKAAKRIVKIIIENLGVKE
ncbi:UDP-N-acetylglucosamine 2-epimerase [Christiangramia flava JLT2011]|nr:UDP-N-acetylglucosamine 2-epimerase [Christiangramia flava JLT2011]